MREPPHQGRNVQYDSTSATRSYMPRAE